MKYNKISDEDLDEMIRRANNATSGPWDWTKPETISGPHLIYERDEDDPHIIECHNWQEKENAMFISSARNCLLDICMELKECRKQQSDHSV